MPRRSSIHVAMILSLLAACPSTAYDSVHAQDVPAPEEFRSVREAIQRGILNGLAPSLAVAVIKDDRLVWAEGFGHADIERGVRATSSSIYRLASISKPITATGIMILRDRGLIDLEAPASRYLPGPRLRNPFGSADEITILRLANHTSGLPVHWNFFYNDVAPPSMDETIRRYGFAASRPGRRWEYSNLAFGILNYITEVVARRSWRAFMKEEVYDKIGMTRTSDRVRPERIADGTVQYRPGVGGTFVRVPYYAFDHPGASAVWSSARDLMRFVRLHWPGDGVRVLSEDSARAMRTRTSRRKGSESGTGIGWFVETHRGQKSISHSGGMPGVSTRLRAYPVARSAFTVLTNVNDRTMTRDVSRRIAAILFPEDVRDESAPAETPTAKLKTVADFAGRWVGRMDHRLGAYRVELVVRPDHVVRVRLNRKRAVTLQNVRIEAGERLFASFEGTLPTQPNFHGTARLEFRVDLEPDRLTGAVVAFGGNHFALAHWLDLRKGADTTPEEVPPAYDVVIRGGRVVDGTGAPWYRADVAIAGGKIAAIGSLPHARGRKSIDAAGLVVAPGFIDMMGQTATPFLEDKGREVGLNLLTQGITTILTGEGSSAAPLSADEARRQGWQTMAEYFERLEAGGLPINVAQTVGHTQVRRVVIGDGDRQASPEEMERMEALVTEAMEAGTIGLSTALIYPPAIYAPTEEIARLCTIVGRHGGRYYTHMRNEGDRLLEAIDEALTIGQQGNVPVHIFHLKAAGRANWGKMAQAITRITAARAGGRDVDADIYPYINNGLSLRALVHPDHFTEGYAAFLKKLDHPELRARMRREMETGEGWENWYRHMGHDWSKLVLGDIRDPRYAEHNGKSLAAVAAALGKDSWETFFELLRDGVFVLPQTMSEANKILAMRQDFVSFCTDVGPTAGSRIKSHPRAFGSFPRILGRYVRELGAISLEQAIAKMAGVAANQIFAYDRGRLSPGLAADVVVFDPRTVGDRATSAAPAQHSVGIRHVLVGGQLVLENSQPTGARPGKVLRGPGHR